MKRRVQKPEPDAVDQVKAAIGKSALEIEKSVTALWRTWDALREVHKAVEKLPADFRDSDPIMGLLEDRVKVVRLKIRELIDPAADAHDVLSKFNRWVGKGKA